MPLENQNKNWLSTVFTFTIFFLIETVKSLSCGLVVKGPVA